ncbi:MAG TPA: sigma-70 family RNA polymerase sigma factor [Verrucomicrobiae bacterium]
MDGHDQDVPEALGHPASSPMPPTLWTVVLEAGAGTETALERLCRLYWLPINAYLRRWGYNEHDAEDFTQTFLAHLLAKDRLAGIRRDKGRFRSYLLGALRNFVIDHNVRKRRLETLPLQAETPGDDRVREPVDPARTPEEEFERRFSLSLIQHALDRTRDDYSQRGQAERFDALRQFLPGEEPSCSQAEIGLRLGIPEGAVAKAVHDLRRRFAQAYRDAVRQTVNTSGEVDDEIKHHMAVLSR